MAERSGRLFAADGGIYLLDDDGMLVREAWTTEGPGAIRVTPGDTLPGVAAAERRGVLANDYPHSPLARPDFIVHGIRHAMAQPLLIGDRVRGVVTMSRSGDDAEPFRPTTCRCWRASPRRRPSRWRTRASTTRRRRARRACARSAGSITW